MEVKGMENEQSGGKIPLTKTDRIIEWVSILVIICTFIHICIAWTSLPDVIPKHFNAAGEADGYGSKYTILIMLPLMLGFYVMLTLVGKYPSIHGYAVTITESNREAQQRMAIRLLRVIKLEIILIFAYLQTQIVISALGRGTGLGKWFLPVMLVVVFGTLGIYLYKSIKSEHK
jgi:uncharacterized membrane protein